MRTALVLAFGWQLATAASLDREIARAIDSSPAAANAFWGIDIVDLTTGKTMYSRNAERLFVPASNAKLFATALALTRLGPDFRFQTRVLADAAPDSAGLVRGLRLVGGGDPNLSARAIPYRMGPATGDPLAAIDELADQLVARGVRRVEGGITGDDTWYTWEPYAPGWALDDALYDYGAPVSALTVNDNTVAVGLRPGARAGDLAELAVTPALGYFTIDNRVQTAPAGAERKVELERLPGTRQLRLWGTLPVQSPAESLLIALDDPAEYAALALRRALENRGVVVEGAVNTVHRYANEPESLPAPGGVELARRESAPLIEDLTITAKVSQNLHAELLLRAVSQARRASGSRKAGLDEMKAFLAEIGVTPEQFSLNDGSGLDRADLVSPAAILQLLRHMYDSPKRESWMAILPVGGQDGTLSSRFGDGPAAGRIHAKTGSLSHVATLSGYAQRRDGTWVAFSILANNYLGPAAEIRSVIDRICTLIVE